MKYKSLILALALLTSGCTTFLAKEINRDREKNGDCEATHERRCIDLIRAAIADIAIGTEVAREITNQNSREAPLPTIDTGDVHCDMAKEKVCSVSRGCHCIQRGNAL